MNAKELLEACEKAALVNGGGSEQDRLFIRALRLLAAAERNDGSTPETDEFAEHDFVMEAIRLHPMILERIKAWADFARTLEQRCNGLAARVGELEGRLAVVTGDDAQRLLAKQAVAHIAAQGVIQQDCPHAAPFRYCPKCVASPCPIGLDAARKP